MNKIVKLIPNQCSFFKHKVTARCFKLKKKKSVLDKLWIEKNPKDYKAYTRL